jgi:hypothetical protein
MSGEYRQLTRNQVCPSIQEGEMLLFQKSEACFKCGKFGHCANECTARKNSIQKQKISRQVWYQLKQRSYFQIFLEQGRKQRNKAKIWKKPNKDKAIISVESKKMRRLLTMVELLNILKQR